MTSRCAVCTEGIHLDGTRWVHDDQPEFHQAIPTLESE